MKICATCNQEKDISFFYKDGERFRKHCKCCLNKRYSNQKKEYRNSHKNEKKSYLSDWKLNNKDRIKELDNIHNEKKRKNRIILSDSYIITLLKDQIGFTSKQCKEYPEFIEIKRLQILIKKLIKLKK